MNAEMIRSSRTKQTKRTQKKKEKIDSTRLVERNQPDQVRILCLINLYLLKQKKGFLIEKSLK
jgi:hypothetical protein